MRPRTLKLPPHLDELIERLSKERNVSRSAVIREALEAYVARPSQSVVDAAGDLVGALEGPRDLSTSPAHLRGFGE